MNSPLQIIIAREYLERVRRKSFIITTLVVPLLILAMMAAPSLLVLLSAPESKNIGIIDDTGVIAARLQPGDGVTFTVFGGGMDDARADSDLDGILLIERGAVDKPSESISFYFRGSPAIATETYLSSQLRSAIEDVRLESYGIPGLRRIVDDIKVDSLKFPTIRMDEGEETATSSALSYAIAVLLDMMLYMFILIYGQMVMSSIIEEKGNRVLEVVVSSVKPEVLMLGKIAGIGLVALTQILIWGVILGCVSAWALPAVGAAVGAVGALPEADAALTMLADPGYVLSLIGWMTVFFVGGYLFYSSIFAAIGSAVDNIQDASQLATVATVPVIIAIVVSMAIMQNPSSTLAVWLSVIPFTSPMCMMARLPFDVPLWQLLLSVAVLCVSFLGMIWLSAKIYRVGIFMYGKKPGLSELIRWARTK